MQNYLAMLFERIIPRFVKKSDNFIKYFLIGNLPFIKLSEGFIFEKNLSHFFFK